MTRPRIDHIKEGIEETLRALGLVLGYLPAAVIPRAVDPWIIRTLTATSLRLRPEKEPRFVEMMASILGEGAQSLDLTKEARSYYEMLFEGPLTRVRALHREGWRPEIEVEGMENLEAGQEAGAGTILWRMPFGSTVTVKAGLWKQGVSLVHLSHEHHGGSAHYWISRNVLMPLYRRSENWYLSERVILPHGGTPTAAMKTLLRRLSRDNAVVSMVSTNPGVQAITTPLFNGQIRIAIGAPALAWKADSTLLPTYTVREGPGQFRVVLDRPIPVDRSLDRKAFVRQAMVEFVSRMESAISRYPGSWSHWGKFYSKLGVYAVPSNPPSDQTT
jgi:lauroyl/myristoyl acyltransferase